MPPSSRKATSDRTPGVAGPALKLAGFVAALGLLLAGAAVAGDAFGPDRSSTEEPDEKPMASATHGQESAAEADHAAPAAGDSGEHGAAHPVRGLAVAENGLRLVLGTPEVRRGARERLAFRIVDERGKMVRDFDVEHEKRMHLIVARRDLTGFQHLHPVQSDDSRWRTRIRIDEAGSYRVFADFVHEGDPYTLASDLRVDGRANLRALPESEPLARVGDGYQVRLDVDGTRAGEAAELRFTIHKDGRAVHVEPYLGAGGHLVALREGDMAFLHVHPTDHADGDPHGGGHDDSVAFEATFPTEGRYRLFLQFKHEGRVHTAAFTQEVTR